MKLSKPNDKWKLKRLFQNASCYLIIMINRKKWKNSAYITNCNLECTNIYIYVVCTLAASGRGVILVSKYQKFAMLRHDLLIGFCTGNSIWCQRGSSISARCEIEGRKRGGIVLAAVAPSRGRCHIFLHLFHPPFFLSSRLPPNDTILINQFLIRCIFFQIVQYLICSIVWYHFSEK